MNPQPTRPIPAVPALGDFGLIATWGNWRDAIAGALIRWGTDSPVNHTFVHIGGHQLVEAAPGGARTRDLDEYDPHAITWSTGRIPLDDVQRDGIATAARAISGTRIGYGWLDLVAIALGQRRLGGVVDVEAALRDQPWWVKRIVSTGTLICSQLVDLVYESAGVPLFDDDRLPGLVSPGDLWRRIGSPTVVTA